MYTADVYNIFMLLNVRTDCMILMDGDRSSCKLLLGHICRLATDQTIQFHHHHHNNNIMMGCSCFETIATIITVIIFICDKSTIGATDWATTQRHDGDLNSGIATRPQMNSRVHLCHVSFCSVR